VTQTIPAEQIAQLPAVECTDAEYEQLQRDDMQGSIASIHLDLLNHTAVITTAGGCVDMTGCIATVMVLDPAIENIQTINGAALVLDDRSQPSGYKRAKDTQYLRDPDAGWYAIDWDRNQPTRSEHYGTAFVVKRLKAILLAALRATKRRPSTHAP
jgi:hypothetical protein